MIEAKALMRETVGMALEDLDAGKTDRVRHHLRTIEALIDGVAEPGEPQNVGRARKPRAYGGRPQKATSKALAAAIVDILEDKEDGMEVRDLMAALQNRGLEIPGQGKVANLIPYLRGIEGVERVRRGEYRLNK